MTVGLLGILIAAFVLISFHMESRRLPRLVGLLTLMVAEASPMVTPALACIEESALGDDTGALEVSPLVVPGDSSPDFGLAVGVASKYSFSSGVPLIMYPYLSYISFFVRP